MNEILCITPRQYRKGYKGQKAFAEYLGDLYKGRQVEIVNNPINHKAVDIVVKDVNGKPTDVYQVVNYKKTTWMSRPRAKRYIGHLKAWEQFYPDIHKGLVISYPECIDKIKGKRTRNGENRTIREMCQDEEVEIWVWKEVRT